jgi:anti-anti-sigma factor
MANCICSPPNSRYHRSSPKHSIHPAGHGIFISHSSNAARDPGTLNFMRDEPLTYSTSAGTREGTTILKLVGPLTLSNMFSLQTDMRALQSPLTIIDLSETEYMDSAGLGVLVNFYVSAQSHGRKTALVGVNNRIDALLDMTHVKTLLRSFPTIEEAEAQA